MRPNSQRGSGGEGALWTRASVLQTRRGSKSNRSIRFSPSGPSRKMVRWMVTRTVSYAEYSLYLTSYSQKKLTAPGEIGWGGGPFEEDWELFPMEKTFHAFLPIQFVYCFDTLTDKRFIKLPATCDSKVFTMTRPLRLIDGCAAAEWSAPPLRCHALPSSESGAKARRRWIQQSWLT